MKKVTFFERLISNSETDCVKYFDLKGNMLPAETKETKWYVINGIVYDATEKVSSEAAKYSANLGILH